MSRTTSGTVLSVQAVKQGAVLNAAALLGDLTVTVDDSTDFDSEAGGSLAINGTVYQYASADDDTGIITLTGAGLAAGAADGDRVDVWNTVLSAPFIEYRALVQLPGEVDNADVLDVRIALPLVLQLPLGLREPGEGEVVLLTEQDDEWVVTDLPGSDPSVGSTLMPTINASDFLMDATGGRVLMYTQTNPVIAVDDTTPGTRTYTVGAGVTVIKREGWGGGGGGGGPTTGVGGNDGGGGGGGAYACDPVVIVNPGDVISYTVGAGGAGGTSSVDGGDGGDSTMGTLVADGGKGGLYDHHLGLGGVGGAGGSASTGAITHKGGYGGNSSFGTRPGGGGSSASPLQDGNDSHDEAGAVGPGADSGDGGLAAFNGFPAFAGGAPGGGGGGGNDVGPFVGAAGGAGRIRITAYAGAPLAASIAPTAGTDPVNGQAYPAGVMVYPTTVADWNTVTTPGTYIGIAGSQSNSPDDTKTWVGETYGRLETGTLVQVVNRLSTGDSAEMWTRQFSTPGGWRPWHAVYADDGWHNLTLKAGFTNAGAINLTPAYRSKTGIVHLRGYANGTFAAGGTTDIVAAGGIPAGLRPANDLYEPCAANGVANAAFLIIRSDGSITVRSGGTVPTWVSLGVGSWIGEV